ncbi:MAG: methyltransferase domain-containing protein [Gammaproteobacteria bacterium]|nr:methyltransferase domain-containing protein [Gammaproteobacteria bacterium]
MTDEVIEHETKQNEINQMDQMKEMIRNTFETVAPAYGLGGARFFHLAGDYMANVHPLRGDEQILDVASGTGTTAIPLARRLSNGRVTAVDFSSSMLAQSQERAKKEGLNNIDFHVHDMTAMPFSNFQFDMATCSFGLFFVDDMVSLLSHITSKVKSGGSVTISGFCGDSFMPQSNLLFDQLREYGVDVPEAPASWKRIAEPAQLHQLFSEAGLKSVEIKRESLDYYVDAEGWWDVVWNAGFRGMVAQLGDNLEDFKQKHFAEIESLMDENGLWLEVDVNFTSGYI